MTVISNIGVFGFGLLAFGGGTLVGWIFAMGSMRVAVRIIMWAISYEKRD